MKFYVLQNGIEAGPFTRDELFVKLRNKEIPSDCQARKESESEWRPLSDLLYGSIFSKEKIEETSTDLPAPPVPFFDLEKPLKTTFQKKNPSKTPLLLVVFLLVLGAACYRFLYIGYTASEESPEVADQIVESSTAPPSNSQRQIAKANAGTSTDTPQASEIKITSASSTQPQIVRVEPPAAITSRDAPKKEPHKKQSQPASLDSPQVANASPPSESASTTPEPMPTAMAKAASVEKQPTQPAVATRRVKDFFSIVSVKYLKREPKDSVGVWSFKELLTRDNRKYKVPDQFQPCLEVKVTADENTRSDKTFARAYFFDDSNRIIASQKSVSLSGKNDDRNHLGRSVLLYKGKADRFFFEIPAHIRQQKWKAVIVFGDRYEAQSACYPPTETDFLLSYPERELVYDRTPKNVVRKIAMDPLIEHVVKTRNPAMPQVTLFMRNPRGVSDSSEIKGILTVCVLANSVPELRQELQKEELSGDYSGLFSFANKHKLAIVTWGARRLWDPGRNYSELSREEKRSADASFDLVANAWERGVKELTDRYQLPKKDFLLWGSCGSAQWAHRLCLRKPEYFLAIAIHIPGSFDKPTPEASNVLWCLTTGELYGGYERAKNFVAECRDLGYPILFKAIVGLGHAGHPDASALNLEFLEFAMSQKAQRELHDEDRNSLQKRAQLLASNSALEPWSEPFKNPPFYGDYVNQEIYPADQVDMIPAGFRTPLPNKQLANIWARSK